MSNNQPILLKGHRFSINTHDQDGCRFLDMFQKCWDLIPDCDRQVILAYWNKSEVENLPLFELSNCWADAEVSHAQVRNNGYQMRFNAKSFLIFPESVALFVIAHELAHVFRWAIGQARKDFRAIRQVNPDDIATAYEAVTEENTDVIAQRWGFKKESFTTLLILTKICGFEEACKLVTMDQAV